MKCALHLYACLDLHTYVASSVVSTMACTPWRKVYLIGVWCVAFIFDLLAAARFTRAIMWEERHGLYALFCCESLPPMKKERLATTVRRLLMLRDAFSLPRSLQLPANLYLSPRFYGHFVHTMDVDGYLCSAVL